MSPRTWLIAAAAVVLLLPALAIAARTYRAEKGLFFPARTPVGTEARAAGIGGLEDVAFPFTGGTVRGWYLPSKNRAALLLLHGSGGDRRQLLGEARALGAEGFGALLIDWPGQGDSDGQVRWGDGERAALSAALDWLEKRPDVDRTRIGAFGFSLGGYVLAQIAAHDPRVKAVVLAGTPSEVARQCQWQNRRWSFLSQWAARWALQRGGMHVDDPQPLALVKSLAPRPLLLVAGTSDVVVPAFMASELHGAARDPKELYVIDGAGHGNYASIAGQTYFAKLTTFFGRALLR
jgi:dipeptidyl aminopeptidase/acylaminoacyl peptidase